MVTTQHRYVGLSDEVSCFTVVSQFVFFTVDIWAVPHKTTKSGDSNVILDPGNPIKFL